MQDYHYHSHPKDELYSERKILRWQTEFTLAQFDREVNAFEENSSGESDFSEEASLCLDDSNDGSLYSEVYSVLFTNKTPICVELLKYITTEDLLINSFLQQLSLFTRQSVRGSILTAETEPEPARHQHPESLSSPAGQPAGLRSSPTQHNTPGIKSSQIIY